MDDVVKISKCDITSGKMNIDHQCRGRVASRARRRLRRTESARLGPTLSSMGISRIGTCPILNCTPPRLGIALLGIFGLIGGILQLSLIFSPVETASNQFCRALLQDLLKRFTAVTRESARHADAVGGDFLQTLRLAPRLVSLVQRYVCYTRRL